jgi:hypothetical protein
MHKILAFILFLGACGISQAQQAVAVKPGGQEVIGLNEPAWNFGKIPQGKPVTHLFIVTNNGSETLTLENVQASCGCTTPEWDHKPIPPGGKSEIKVGYNALAEGAFEKTISIFYNKGQLKTLTIRGDVWRTPEQPAPKNTSTALLKNLN